MGITTVGKKCVWNLSRNSLVDGLRRVLRVSEVAHHDVPRAHADLSVAVGIRVDDLGPAAVQRLPDRPEAVMSGAVSGLRPGRLAHAVALEKRNVEAQEVFERFPGDRSSADTENLGLV